ALLDEPAGIDDRPALDWVASTVAELDGKPNFRRFAQATAFGYYDHNLIGIVEHAPGRVGLRERLRKLHARQVVLATGAIERPLVFPNNDRPGVMLASAVLAYAHRFGVLAGRRAVIVTNNSAAYRTAFALMDAGMVIAAIADLRRLPPAAPMAETGRRCIRVLAGHGIVDVAGRMGVTAATVAPIDHGPAVELGCDLVLMSGGWTPTVHLFSQSGGQLGWDRLHGCPVPAESKQAERSAGAATGGFGLAEALEQGALAGAAAATALGLVAPMPPLPAARDGFPLDLAPIWEMPVASRRRAFVDFQNDVTAADVRLADREGYRSIEHVKRYTTGGMAIDQGKTANLNIIDALARAQDRGPAAVGTTTYRPPYTPVSFGALAGQDAGPLILPVRETPMTAWHIAAGAVMYEAAATWRRPGYYPKPGEGMEEATLRECRAVRTSVGIYDSSPLGKFELRGPDAATFLDRIYCTRIVDLPIGRIRYGLMLRDDGRLFDDGTVLRLGPEHFFVTSTTGNADAVAGWLERWRQCEWPELKVWITPVTTYWANAVVCGPHARDVIARVAAGVELDRRAFPFMAMRAAKVAGLPARIMRVSFTGELSFEVNVPARHGLALWRALMAAGRDLDITPVGSEGSHVLRVEKGYISVGHE
ncbi:MAG: sarcosine oxidase subunit alpha, partial [Alphaproteobacteria bacterium]|nr:sarcosine oxidase subunit alpha [Alphaproteobacteria bacterium]